MTDMSWMPWVVGGVMVLSFLYMKVWPFVRTIIRAFRGPRFKSVSYTHLTLPTTSRV